MIDFNVIGTNGFQASDTNVPLLCDKNSSTFYKHSELPLSLFFNPKSSYVPTKMQIDGYGTKSRRITPELYGSNDGVNYTLLYRSPSSLVSLSSNIVIPLPEGLPAFKHFRINLNAVSYDANNTVFKDIILTGIMTAVTKYLVTENEQTKTYRSGVWEIVPTS